MKKWLLAISVAMALATASVPAHARKACDELKQEIAAKIDARGVKSYALDVVAPDAVGDARVVGSCDGGTQRITYRRDRVARPEAVAKSEAAPAR